MSKAQNIRKKALDLVRDQDWPNAIKEYKRLVELDQNNPNVHNELADLWIGVTWSVGRKVAVTRLRPKVLRPAVAKATCSPR